jgi:hypothetical protein
MAPRARVPTCPALHRGVEVTELWPAARRILKWCGIVAGSLALAALTLFAVAFAVNSRDEPLTPQVRALLQVPSDASQPDDNIYLALLGFDAPAGQSVTAAGEARIEHYNRSLDGVLQDPAPSRVASLTAQDPHRLAFRGEVSFLHPLEGSVWREAAEHRQEIEKLLADNSELYRRYLELLPMRGYYESARASEFAPLAGAPGEVRMLFLAAIALHLRSVYAPERERALADLEGDVQLWRTVLTAKGALPSKMLSIACLQSDYLLLADLIADWRALPGGAPEADFLVPVFELTDFDIGSAFAAEFRMTVPALTRSGDPFPTELSADGRPHGDLHGWLSRAEERITGHFFKINATENLLARQTARQMLAAADPRKFRASIRDGLLLEDQSVWTLPLSYNPVGKAMAAVATPVYDNYPRRAWDAAALQRLVRVAYEIRRRQIDASGIPPFLEGHPEWSRHPADGRPLLWNAATRELRVQTVAQYPSPRRFSIRIWQPAPPVPDPLAPPVRSR